MKIRWGYLIAFVISICLSFGCGGQESSSVNVSSGSEDPENHRWLEFIDQQQFMIVDAGVAEFSTQIRFSVLGSRPIRIMRISTTCSCSVPGKELINSLVEPGVQYSIPVTIKVSQGSEFTIGVTVETDVGLSNQIECRGISLSNPFSQPRTLECKFASGGSTQQLRQKIVVRRTRRSSHSSLIPLFETISGQCVELSYVGRTEEVIHKRTGKLVGDEDVVEEQLIWNCKLTKNPSNGDKDIININWSDGAVPAAEVAFVYSEAPAIRGLVAKLQCGKLAPGERWSHTLILDTRNSKKGGIASAESDVPFITTSVRRANNHELTFLDVGVTAPEKAGSFDGCVQIDFSRKDIDSVSFQVSGFVFVNPATAEQ